VASEEGLNKGSSFFDDLTGPILILLLPIFLIFSLVNLLVESVSIFDRSCYVGKYSKHDDVIYRIESIGIRGLTLRDDSGNTKRIRESEVNLVDKEFEDIMGEVERLMKSVEDGPEEGDISDDWLQ
jgi:hypothetical protein